MFQIIFSLGWNVIWLAQWWQQAHKVCSEFCFKGMKTKYCKAEKKIRYGQKDKTRKSYVSILVQGSYLIVISFFLCARFSLGVA